MTSDLSGMLIYFRVLSTVYRRLWTNEELEAKISEKLKKKSSIKNLIFPSQLLLTIAVPKILLKR